MTESPPDASDPSAVFGAAAHEIKNALGPLAMTLQLAERQLLAGQPIAPADLAFARAQVRRLSRLVEDLMDLTRADLDLLLNLLENAARYSPEGAPITVTVAPSGAGAVRVTVRDRGPGIAAAEQARIFQRFVRGAASEGKGGLGIGLYLCRSIMERHGGAIGVDSTVGGGAAFWIDLPR